MNSTARYLEGSEKNIPLFRSLGITVPEILASDYTQQFIPLCYQVQSRLNGTDLGHIIQSLTQTQLTGIANT
jgi:hypothetical protein